MYPIAIFPKIGSFRWTFSTRGAQVWFIGDILKSSLFLGCKSLVIDMCVDTGSLRRLFFAKVFSIFVQLAFKYRQNYTLYRCTWLSFAAVGK